jgi:steroid delta-isomerase-like uncharacterized protein
MNRNPNMKLLSLALCIVALCSAALAADSAASLVEKNKASVRRIFESIWNEAQLESIEDVWAASVPFHFRAMRPRPMAPDALRAEVQRWRKAFPDFRFTVEDIIGEGDRVAIRVRYTGTHTGAEWFGLPPTGKKVNVTEMMFFRLDGGKVVEAWEDYDEFVMRRQLGALPTTEKKSP